MVNNAASFGRSGVHDFILLRASSIILAAYSLFIAFFFICTPEVTYTVWQSLFSGMPMKIFTILAVISVLIHAWIGIWQVLSDYVKCAMLRGTLQFVFSVVLFVYLATGFLTVWGV